MGSLEDVVLVMLFDSALRVPSLRSDALSRARGITLGKRDGEIEKARFDRPGRPQTDQGSGLDGIHERIELANAKRIVRFEKYERDRVCEAISGVAREACECVGARQLESFDGHWEPRAKVACMDLARSRFQLRASLVANESQAHDAAVAPESNELQRASLRGVGDDVVLFRQSIEDLRPLLGAARSSAARDFHDFVAVFSQEKRNVVPRIEKTKKSSRPAQERDRVACEKAVGPELERFESIAPIGSTPSLKTQAGDDHDDCRQK